MKTFSSQRKAERPGQNLRAPQPAVIPSAWSRSIQGAAQWERGTSAKIPDAAGGTKPAPCIADIRRAAVSPRFTSALGGGGAEGSVFRR
jgi:hypothetical protein